MIGYKRITNKLVLILLFAQGFSVLTFAQQTIDSEVEETVKQFFNFMKKGDIAQLDSLLLDEVILTTITSSSRKNEIQSKVQFLNSVKLVSEKIPDTEERISNLNIRYDQDLAVVSAAYSFFIERKFSHCGLDVLVLAKKNGKWKITSIYDTRHKDICDDSTEDDINKFLNNWHLAASKADENIFFSSMASNGIYIGTDATERWTRDEMQIWSKKYFDRESAWDFKPIERKINFSSDRKTAWFNETLNTWMGVCRGSGILIKSGESWKIQQYHLSVTVPNDLIEGFVKLVGAPGRKKY